jgi:hypothetical protein
VAPCAVKFLEITDGRDKLAKGAQNLCRALAWHFRLDPYKALAFASVAAKLSEYRSVIKFFKWLKNIRDIRYRHLFRTCGSPRLTAVAVAQGPVVGR